MFADFIFSGRKLYILGPSTMTDSISSSTFTSRGSAQFNWHSCTVASLKVPAMAVYDVATKVPDTVISSAQHRWPDLWHCIFVSVRRSLYGGRKYTHTRTRTRTHIQRLQGQSTVPSLYCRFK